MRYEDLPAALRRKVDAATGGQPKRPRGSRGITSGGRWRCCTPGCDVGEMSWPEAERHDPAHHRLECVQ